MSVGFTFGSLGDILQLCQIGIAVGKALNESRGSARDYQNLRNDLDQFVHVLQNVRGKNTLARLASKLVNGTYWRESSGTDECAST